MQVNVFRICWQARLAQGDQHVVADLLDAGDLFDDFLSHLFLIVAVYDTIEDKALVVRADINS
jgi:hypothetical protein